ncbi:hypothetical protein [Nocardioides montaniterrae]
MLRDMVVAVLVLLVVQSLLGVLALLRWRRALRTGASFPWPLVASHVLVADIATALWIARLVTDAGGWGWASFGVLLVGNGLGDLVLAGRWRLDAAVGGRWLTGWVSGAKGLLDPRRRVGALHATGAGVVTVLVLVACILG